MKKNKLFKILDYLFDIKTSRLLLAFKNNGYLIETGWLNSYKIKQPIDNEGNPIPWTTYSFIRFIDNYLKKEMVLFEYGSGNSTIFYSKRVKEITTVEHDKIWYDKLTKKLPGNVNLIYRELNLNYECSINEFKTSFDIVIIDGRRRNNCLEQSIEHIKPEGIIVLDDSERENYKSGIELLKQHNFKQIDFWGISPGYFHDKCTSIFFHDLKI
jgi:hypothetical protein